MIQSNEGNSEHRKCSARTLFGTMYLCQQWVGMSLWCEFNFLYISLNGCTRESHSMEWKSTFGRPALEVSLKQFIPKEWICTKRKHDRHHEKHNLSIYAKDQCFYYSATLATWCFAMCSSYYNGGGILGQIVAFIFGKCWTFAQSQRC